jgi:hypothetical protein
MIALVELSYLCLGQITSIPRQPQDNIVSSGCWVKGPVCLIRLFNLIWPRSFPHGLSFCFFRNTLWRCTCSCKRTLSFLQTQHTYTLCLYPPRLQEVPLLADTSSTNGSVVLFSFAKNLRKYERTHAMCRTWTWVNWLYKKKTKINRLLVLLWHNFVIGQTRKLVQTSYS